MFAGDVHFMDRTAKLLKDPATAFGPIASQLSAADLTIVNLETAITSRGAEEPKTYHFRTTPVAIDALKAAGIDAVSIANNHTLDYGRVGLLDTLDALHAASFPAFGAGADVESAYRPWLTTVRGVKIAVLGFSQVGELSSSWAPARRSPASPWPSTPPAPSPPSPPPASRPTSSSCSTTGVTRATAAPTPPRRPSPANSPPPAPT
ncbi:hypothetical protein GCM10027610_096400 [Dactylosporangium cerinum]